MDTGHAEQTPMLTRALFDFISVRSEVSQITCVFLGDLWGLGSGYKLLTGEPHTDTSALFSVLDAHLGPPQTVPACLLF